MDVEKVISAMCGGACYQVEGLQLTGCGDRVRVYAPRRGACFISAAEAVVFIRAAAAAGKVICRRT